MNGQDKILEGLNAEQYQAVTHVDGPLLVLAGAGSGKTRVLTSRVAYLVAQGHAAPEQILAVTFTNKAAGEMKARIEKLTAIDQRRMQVSTFHSFSSLLLRFYGDRFGVPKNFTIYDEDDAMSLIKTSITELGLDIKTTAPPMVRGKISDAKSQLVDSGKYLTMAGNFITERVARVYELYQKKLFAARAVDFDDLLFFAVKILREDEETRIRLQNKYHYVMIDEYQDTNHAQYMLAKLLTASHKNLFAVGDEDQSIYGWRGATIDNILNFEKDYPGCRLIRLEQNYRSTQTILKAASEVVANNQMRKGKTLYSVGDKGDPVSLLIVETDRDEAEKICENIETLIASGTVRREIAILYRTNAQSRAIEESLKRRFIPYRIVGGLRFYQRKEIKDMMAYLRLIENPKDDVSFRRIINYPKRGIGDTTVAAMAELARTKSLSLYELAADKGANQDLGRTVVAKLARFVEMITYFKEMSRTLPLEPLLTLVAERSGINKDLKDNDPSGNEGRLDNVAELASSAGDFGLDRTEATLADFLQEISLYTDLDNWDRDSDSVTLMTIHAAKGLEFESVFVAGLEEGLFPLGRSLENPADLEEERRLFYVGMTRAKKRLFISYANMRARLGGRQSIRSRFVDELPDEVVVAERHTMMSAYGSINQDYEQSVITMQNDQFAAIRVGSSVAHARWGEGTVLNRSGTGDSTEVEVRFHFAGTKKLLAKYAKLRVLT